MDIVAARRSTSRPELGLVTLRGTLTKNAAAPVEVFRARFTGMFGLRPADA
jgi:hypothetical protein